jgi:hypothetical protein
MVEVVVGVKGLEEAGRVEVVLEGGSALRFSLLPVRARPGAKILVEEVEGVAVRAVGLVRSVEELLDTVERYVRASNLRPARVEVTR